MLHALCSNMHSILHAISLLGPTIQLPQTNLDSSLIMAFPHILTSAFGGAGNSPNRPDSEGQALQASQASWQPF